MILYIAKNHETSSIKISYITRHYNSPVSGVVAAAKNPRIFQDTRGRHLVHVAGGSDLGWLFLQRDRPVNDV